MLTPQEKAAILERRREWERAVEARDRALRDVVRELVEIDRERQMCNYGTVGDLVDGLRQRVSDEFGTPFLVQRHLDALNG